MDASLHTKLRQLLSEYSPKEVNDTLQHIFTQDYAFYKSHFSESNKPSVQSEPVLERAKKPVKRSEHQQLVIKKRPEEVQSLKLNADEVDSVEEILPSTLLKTEKEDSEKRAWIEENQKKKEEETFAKLQGEGVNPESLLTRENLHEWLEVQKYNFAYIARELVGLSQAQVRYAAKAFNIKSPITKQRQNMIAKKLTKKA